MNPILPEQILAYNKHNAINHMATNSGPEKENGSSQEINSLLDLIEAVRTIFFE